MGYEKLATQPAPRGPNISYEQLAPGLYPDEIAVKLDDGTLVAVSVERHWQENGSGIGFHGYARWIREDGQTETAPNGAHVEASYSFHADPVTLTTFAEDNIATEVARVVLGEEPQLHKDVPQVEGPPIPQPVIHLSDVVRLNASIRHQVKAVAATKSSFIGL